MQIKIDTLTKGTREIVLPGSTLKAYLICRDESPVGESSTVYVLMDNDRRGFYIGQTGAGDNSFAKRFGKHRKDPREEWWSLAVCFVDTSGRFDSEKLRKWIESRLNEIAKNRKYVVVSSAGKSGPAVAHSEEMLEKILGICWLLGIPWAEVKSITATASSIVSKPKSHAVPSRKVLSAGKKDKYHGFSAIVIRALMKHIFDNGLVTASDIKAFVSPASHENFKIGSAKICTMMIAHAKYRNKIGGHVRYYPDKYSFGGKDYALCSQLFPTSVPKFLEMAAKYGLSEDDVANLCPDPNRVLNFFKEKCVK